MASNINPYNVDGTFPVAGQDNSSQGFRDNFTNIKNNLLFAQNEISDLQSKTLVTSALAGQPINNDMAGAQIKRPQLSAWTQTMLDNGVVTGAVSLDFNQANFQKLTAAGSLSLSFINWPASSGAGAMGYGVMRVWIVITDSSQIIQLPYNVNITDDSLSSYNGAGALAFDNVGNYIFDVSSIDGGTTFIIEDLTRNRSHFTDPNFYYNIEKSPAMYVGFGGGYLNSSSTAVTQYFSSGLHNIQTYIPNGDMLVTFGSVNSVGVGNLSLANVGYGHLDAAGQNIGGFTVSSARGNLLATGASAVTTNDMIGYLNAESFTGNGTVIAGNIVNSFQQSAGIYFFSKGSDFTNGIGGNISIYTVADGGPAAAGPIQALSIENDQSTHVYGAFYTASTIVERGTYVANLSLSSISTITSSISTLILDSTNSATIASATVFLPNVAIDKQRISISSVTPITSANVFTYTGSIKYVPTNYFATGNIGIHLTYSGTNSTWYRS
jgi:hypothetical protein